VLKLTEAARPLLRGEQPLILARSRVKPKPPGKPKAGRMEGVEYDEELFQSLRALRKRLADETKVPPYVIFGDATLVEMAATRPVNEMELLNINGVGQIKLERYGSDFLKVIRGGGREESSSGRP
jgi:ATP-dependent DNA helicase RecQ